MSRWWVQIPPEHGRENSSKNKNSWEMKSNLLSLVVQKRVVVHEVLLDADLLPKVVKVLKQVLEPSARSEQRHQRPGIQVFWNVQPDICWKRRIRGYNKVASIKLPSRFFQICTFFSFWSFSSQSFVLQQLQQKLAAKNTSKQGCVSF